jgi:hypothetical protein
MRNITPVNDNPVCDTVGPGERRRAGPPPAIRPPAQSDSLELSEMALALGRLEGEPPSRAARIARLGAAVRDDTYVTNEKIERVINRLLDEFRA